MKTAIRNHLSLVTCISSLVAVALASNALVFDVAGGGTASISAFSHTAPTMLIMR